MHGWEDWEVAVGSAEAVPTYWQEHNRTEAGNILPTIKKEVVDDAYGS